MPGAFPLLSYCLTLMLPLHLRVLSILMSTRESFLALLTHSLLLLTKYDTAHQSAHFHIADASPYCTMTRYFHR